MPLADEGSHKPPLGFIPDKMIQLEMMDIVTMPSSPITNVDAMAQQTTKMQRKQPPKRGKIQPALYLQTKTGGGSKSREVGKHAGASFYHA